MSLVTTDLPSDPDELRALAQALQEQLASVEQARVNTAAALASTADELASTAAELRAAKAAIQLTALEIEKLKVQLARLRRMQFGQSSERLSREIDQLELRLEDLEAIEAEAISASADAGIPPPAREKRQPKRLPLPDHLPRQEVVHAAPHADGCGACGGTMSALGEDVTEVLEYVPGRFQVVRHVRPKLACQRCDAITQASAPALPIPRGKAGPGLLAHVLVSKYADHLPLYRQAEIYAREGVDLDRSTMADWVGQVSWLLQPLVEHIRRHVFAADKIHTDDTPVPVLAPGSGKTKTGRLWVYARDDRGWQGIGPPAAAYFYTPDRKGERPRSHLASFTGFLQADGYAGYDQLYDGRRQPGPIYEVACWAHVRRKIYDVWKATDSITARTGVSLIDLMYEAEELGRGLPLEERLERRQVVRVGVDGFFNWAEDTLRRISNKGALADAIRYAVKRREALTRFCDDARLEADNNRAENCLRPIALGRKNYLFAGSDKGGERAAAIYTLLQTAKLNHIDPEAWLRDVLTRIADGHPANRIGELAPWC
ncbi:transposase [Croceibacterium mercuriale]|uniref:Transposase n=1 Tax=Croceibacterium mercuriale TaxID=1572751 RepID=A0A0B2BU63_9SPHN|nr:IS66 family transposase [Croceibacterium mercuriale]KHL24984.1 transposase [Croceibacterium mercuriale]